MNCQIKEARADSWRWSPHGNYKDPTLLLLLMFTCIFWASCQALSFAVSVFNLDGCSGSLYASNSAAMTHAQNCSCL